MLKRKSTSFDVKSQILDIVPLWVKLQVFLIKYWLVDVFKEKDHSLGLLLEVNISFRNINKMTLAKILVGIDLRGGLASKIVIQKGTYSITQDLEYYGVPFR